MPRKPLQKLTRTLLMSASLLLAGTLPVATCCPAYGQGITTGTISGTVTDASGAIIPGAQVVAVRKSTGSELKTVSEGSGNFSLTNLPIGDYTVTISMSGFSDLKVEQVIVTSGSNHGLGKEALSAGSTSQEVTVTSTSALLNTTQAQVSSTFTTQQLTDLPLNNGFDVVALLTPGTVQTHDSSFSNNNGASFSSNGQRGRSNNFELDGQSNNDNSVGGPQVFFSNQDALSEVNVITNDFSAQYGRNTGSVVNYVTKSGTNDFHGSGFETWLGSKFESLENSQKNPLLAYCTPGQDPATTGCAPVVLPRYTENRFGGTIGGPVLKDRLFFFGSAYFDRNHQGGGNAVSGTALTPNPAGLQALAAAFPSNPGVSALVNSGPYSIKTGNPQPVGPVVSQTITVNGVSAAVPFQGISRSVPSQSNDEEVLGRLDWQPTEKDHIFLRYFYQDDPFLNGGGSVPEGAWYNVPDTAHSIGGDWVHSFSPIWSNQLRYSFQQTSVTFQSGAQSNCTISSPTNCNSSVTLRGSFDDAAGNSYSNLSFGYPDNIPQGRVVKVNQVQDNASWTAGRHSILFGGEYEKQNSPNGFLPNYNGSFSYNNFDALTSGVSSLNIADGSFSIPFTENDYALYFQDDWKIMPSLTLNLGLRWEFFGQAVNLLHDETVTRESNPATAIWDQSLPLAARTFPKVNSNFKNFQPRLGFAYNPDFDRSLVVRGGFAINFDPAFYNLFLDAADVAPVASSGTIKCNGSTTVCQSGSGATGAQTRSLALPFFPLGGNPNLDNQTDFPANFRNPYTESFYFGLSRQFSHEFVVDMRYVGSHAVGQFQALNANPDLLATATAFPNVLSPSSFCQDPNAVGYGHLDCNRTNLRQFANTAFSIYNALQIKGTVRAFHGLTADVNYTYSRAQDNASEVFDTLAGGNTIAYAPNPFATDIPERGVSGISIPNVVSVSASYTLPLFAQNRSSLMGRALGGIEINGIYQHDDGQPATAYQTYSNQQTGDTSYCDNSFSTAYINPYDSCRPLISNPSAPIGSVGYYLSPANASASQPAGWYDYISGAPISGPQAVHWLHNDTADIAATGGTNPFAGVSRGTLRATHFSKLDTSVYKTTKITERVSFQFQFTAYNVLNQQFYGTPDPEIEDPSFQQTYFNTGTNRNLSFGGKIIF